MLRSVLYSLVAACVMLSAVYAAETGDKKDEAPKYSVVRIDDAGHGVRFLVVEDKEVKNVKKELNESYKEEMKEWKDDKKEGIAGKKPVKPKVKVLKKGLSKEDADKQCAEAEKEYKEKNMPRYSVIRVFDGYEVKFEVVEDKEVKKIKKKLAKEYKKYKKMRERERREAAKRPPGFGGMSFGIAMEMRKPKVKVLKKGMLSKEDAEECCAKAEKKYKEKQEKEKRND